MKIAWFTPFARNSAIGCYSKLATDALKDEKYHVEIFTFCQAPYHHTTLTVNCLQFDEFDCQLLDKFDLVFYNIGDNVHFHSHIFDVAQKYPGILILHDLSLMNFFIGYYSVYKNDCNARFQQLSEMYGEENALDIFSAMSSVKTWNQLDFVKYNCIPWLTKLAKGVIVHSNYHFELLSQHFHGPSKCLYFPYHSCHDQKLTQKMEHSEKVHIVSAGYVNPNKRIAQVITAIGKNIVLKRKIHYTVVGKLDGGAYETELHMLIEKYELQNIVTLKGYLSDDDLETIYQDADIFVNLRKPAIEGASWSLIEQMDHAKPVIVIDNGFYHEIPDTCVWKISSDDKDEITSIQTALLALVKDQKSRNIIGEKGKEFFTENFSPKRYAQVMNEFCHQIEFLKPLYTLVNYISDELSICGINTDMEISKNIAHEMDDIFFQYQGKVD